MTSRVALGVPSLLFLPNRIIFLLRESQFVPVLCTVAGPEIR